MNKLQLIREIKEMLVMIYNSYGVLNHYQVELLEDTLNDCLLFIKGVKKWKIYYILVLVIF